jgi:hypothetical protein
VVRFVRSEELMIWVKWGVEEIDQTPIHFTENIAIQALSCRVVQAS